MNDDSNQTTQTLAVRFRERGSHFDPFGDYPLLQVTKTRETPEDPGTIVWSLVGSDWLNTPRKELTPEQLHEALLELFYQQAIEIDAPHPQPPLLFGNLRIVPGDLVLPEQDAVTNDGLVNDDPSVPLDQTV